MSHFLINGNTYRIFADDALNLQPLLPVGNYIIQKNPQTEEYFLESVDGFKAPKKLYGTTTRHTDRILNTFESRSSSTGVMLAGLRGSGKTLLARNLSIVGAEHGYPTLLINTPLCGEAFNRFIQKIEQPAIVVFDEFEKIYDHDEQEQILTLLDGVFPTKKMFIFTCNDKWKIDINMRNRPGRIYYMLNFSSLDDVFIREYCEDNLNDKSHIESVVRISTIFNSYNFDMLQALVEEMNRYGETPQEALQMLNSKPEFEEEQIYDVSVLNVATGRLLEGRNEFYPNQIKANPLAGKFSVEIYGQDDFDEGDYKKDTPPKGMSINLTTNSLTNIDSTQKTFSFVSNGYNVMLKKQPSATYYSGFVDF